MGWCFVDASVSRAVALSLSKIKLGGGEGTEKRVVRGRTSG